MKIFSSKRRVAAVAALVLLALFLVRPGASRLKSRIINSLSASVGRPVDIGAVHIHLLPRPGFDLDGLVVYDDPAFGAEPMLRASEVSADLRVLSLLRGRLEVARLDLTEPSLNLVHSEGGRWNLEALLERTAHTPLAPTGKSKSEPRPAFPYIEGTSARINFKSGFEKKPYALTSADFALWQESENAWGVRLKAQPFRADLNLNDIGLLQVNGTWQRAETLRDTPLHFDLEWNRAQLGQVSKFLTGNDKGWRGEIRIDATLTGSPAKLKITSAASVDDFRRYDITNGSALRLAARCDGEYSSLTREFRNAECRAPVGAGLVSLTGNFSLPGNQRYALVVSAENVPAGALAMLAQRAKKNIPDDLTVDGMVQGKFTMRYDTLAGSKSQFEGRGEIAGLRMSSASLAAEFEAETVPFTLVGDSNAGARRREAAAISIAQGTHLEFGPFPNAKIGAPSIRGWANRGGYAADVVGDLEVARTLRLARMIGIPAPAVKAEGPAQVNLQIAGSWAAQGASGSGFLGPQVTGSARLRNVKVPLYGSGAVVEIAFADIQLAPDAVRVGKLLAKAAGANWTGSLQMPRGCGTPEKCPVRFALNADEMALVKLNEWASGAGSQRPWYRVLNAAPQAGPSLLSRIQASGTLTAGRLVLRSVTATRVSADVSLDTGKLQIAALEADFLGGKHHGKWQADFSVKPVTCGGSGKLSEVSLAKLADAMKDPWIAGYASGSYEVSGSCTADFWQSAEGTFKAAVKDGVLPHILIRENSEPLRAAKLTGEGRLRAGEIEISNAKLDTADGKYELSGTASLTREVNVKLTRVPSSATPTGYAISGTLATPSVASLNPTEQARLKTVTTNKP